MVWPHFENELRKNPKENFKHETKWKMPKRKTEIKMGRTG
jgi:hypothetical protein